MDILREYKMNRIKRKIDSLPEDDIVFDDYAQLPLYQQIAWKDCHSYTIVAKYKHKYHFAEIFNRVTCRERNKPNSKELSEIKSRLNGDYSQDSIYRKCNYNERKHLIYIWETLNGIGSLVPNEEYFNTFQTIWNNFNVFYREFGYKKRAIKYRLVIDVICERLGFGDIRKRLYFKDNKNHRDIVHNVLNEALLKSNSL